MRKKISLIVAMDEAGGIGWANRLLCHLPADLKYFKAMTLHKPIVMGRKTYESIGRPLPDRENIVLSRCESALPGVQVVHMISEVIELSAPEIMIIGGAEIFKLFLPLATDLYITRIHHCFEADVFFPKIDMSEWVLCSSREHPQDEKNIYPLTFQIFRRRE
jgi:dihydrofolate reductase